MAPEKQTEGPFTERKEEIAAAMAARDAERLEKRKDRLADANPEEDVHHFFKMFTEKLEGLRGTLTEIEAAAAAGEARDSLEKRFESLAVDQKDVYEFANAGSLHLPPFDQRSMQMKMSKFEEERASTQARVVPRKKFSFKKKDKKKASAAGNMAAAEAGSRHSDAMIGDAPESSHPKLAADPPMAAAMVDERAVLGRRGEVVVVEASELAGRDYFISDCEDCTILLLGSMGALRMQGVRRCRVLTGPVTGGCHIEHADRSVFQLAVHQFRLHHTTGCDFYLRARSNPIIEDCTGLRFAPYSLQFDGIDVLLAEAGLSEVECGDKWSAIQDFKWLRQQQSPNWAVLPEAERDPPQLPVGVGGMVN